MTRHRVSSVVSLVVAASTLGLAGCFATTTDYQRDAEAYIADAVAEALDASFTQVECQRPVDQNVGTRFECTALDDANGTWVFENEITDDDAFEVNVFSRP